MGSMHASSFCMHCVVAGIAVGWHDDSATQRSDQMPTGMAHNHFTKSISINGMASMCCRWPLVEVTGDPLSSLSSHSPFKAIVELYMYVWAARVFAVHVMYYCVLFVISMCEVDCCPLL